MVSQKVQVMNYWKKIHMIELMQWAIRIPLGGCNASKRKKVE